MKILLDTCGLIGLSVWDPSAATCTRWASEEGHVFVLSHIAIQELIERAYDNPFDSHVIRDVTFLLNLDPWICVKSPHFGVVEEIGRFPALARVSHSESNHRDLILMLRGIALGQFDVSQRGLRNAAREHDENTMSDFERLIDENPDPLVTKNTTYEDYKMLTDARDVAANIAIGCFATANSPCSHQRMELALDKLPSAPKDLPYLAGLVRVNVFTNWHSHAHGKTSGMPDLKQMQHALCVGAVCSNDKKLLHRGPIIFPEADWIDLVGSSRVDLQACKLEYSIVSPK